MSEPARRAIIAGIGEQAAYVAADPASPFFGRERLARTVGFLHHFGPLSDADLLSVDCEWNRLHSPLPQTDAELLAMLDMIDRLAPDPPPPDDSLAELLAMLDPGPLPPLPSSDDLARLLAQLDAMGVADRGRR